MRPWCDGRGRTFVRTADAAVLRAQKTRSKDRRCFTVLCHHTTASRLFFPIADSESQRMEEKVGEDGRASEKGPDRYGGKSLEWKHRNHNFRTVTGRKDKKRSTTGRECFFFSVICS